MVERARREETWARHREELAEAEAALAARSYEVCGVPEAGGLCLVCSQPCTARQALERTAEIAAAVGGPVHELGEVAGRLADCRVRLKKAARQVEQRAREQSPTSDTARDLLTPTHTSAWINGMILAAPDLSNFIQELGPFWKSDIFWGAVAALAALGTIWATMRAANPRRTLHYEFNVMPLVQQHEGLTGSLEIRFNGNLLQDPHIIWAGLSNMGKRDISSSHFDQDRPIKMIMGVSVVNLLSIVTHGGTAAAPTASVQGGELHVGPGRIGRGDVVTYALLVDGKPNCSLTHELIDVKVKQERSIELDDECQ